MTNRKFKLSIFSLFLILLFPFLCLIASSLIPLYSTFIGGVLGVYGLYCGGNVVNKAVKGKYLGREIDGADAE